MPLLLVHSRGADFCSYYKQREYQPCCLLNIVTVILELIRNGCGPPQHPSRRARPAVRERGPYSCAWLNSPIRCLLRYFRSDESISVQAVISHTTALKATNRALLFLALWCTALPCWNPCAARSSARYPGDGL